ncbi:28S ribosomal protein S36, mitochondrial isoform X2 [Syngnathoides biaculeatus]|uniref:28S ribosomal protein S36, mitochondrial isoform X2 n=1 Tax=Syngnathoides biaculeatus TaxID=300417 RepID=UPI002ADDDA50|nr:28S ribosomal protein S36, mitochondrial isoform X2 [Syngnathoides biaculeatus]
MTTNLLLSYRTWNAVRPHAPMIKFPSREGIPKPNAQEVLKTMSVNTAQPNNPSSASASAPPKISNRVTLPPIPGAPDTLASIQLLPARYRRRPMVVEEMEYIQRGGPE